MNSRFTICNEPDSSDSDERKVLEGLKAHNTTHAKTHFNRKKIRLFGRNENQKIIAGLFGYITFHWLGIEILWVDESMRGTGIGKELVAQAEALAKEVGAIGATVETTSFQAKPFYESQGFEVFAILEDNPIGDVTYYLKKRWGE